MPVLITAANAREMSARANRARWDRYRSLKAAGLLPKLKPAPEPVPINPRESPDNDPIVAKLKRALEEKVDALLKCKDPKECAQLALAIRAVRETYHLVTGEARPGVRRDGRRRGPAGGAAWRETPAKPVV